MKPPFAKYQKKRILRMFVRAQAPLKQKLERSMILDAKLLDTVNLSKPMLSSLHEIEYGVFSQWGEDGIIAWLVAHLQDIPKTFIEFGVEDYQESNTRYLLQSRNWRGLIIDGTEHNIAGIRCQDFYWRHELTADCNFINRENINALLKQHGFNGQIGLLSIDIDGNDYWVWQAIDVVKPAVVVCEFNAVFGDSHALTVPFKSDFQRSIAHHSCLYFGASIRALIRLAEHKGYTFVGTTSTGCNAFFVRNDHAQRITSKLEGITMFPSFIREARDKYGALQFISGAERAQVMADQCVFDLETDNLVALSEFSYLYSPQWIKGLPRTLPSKKC